MPETKTKRRGQGEDSIFFVASRNRYVGDVSVGFRADGRRVRRRVSGRTKQEVKDKLKALHVELDAGLKVPRSFSVRQAVDGWLRDGLDGTSERTRKLYEGLLAPLMELIGNRQLRELSATEVRTGLGKLKSRYSTRSLQITRNSLERAITHAQADDLVGRNVAALVKVPKGRDGRPSKSFTIEETKVVLVAAEGTRLAGEDRFAIYVWRSERAGGDTKTQKSRRTLALPRRCAQALRKLWAQQERDRERAGDLWQENGLLFASRLGTALTANNVIRAFRIITKKAGLGADWVPREMRHTFVSVLSANGVSIETISDLIGHEQTATTELIYRHEIRPALTEGAEIMDKIFAR